MLSAFRARLYLHEQFVDAAAWLEQRVTARSDPRLTSPGNLKNINQIRLTLRLLEACKVDIGNLLGLIGYNENLAEGKTKGDFQLYVKNIGTLKEHYDDAAAKATKHIEHLERAGLNKWFFMLRGAPGLHDRWMRAIRRETVNLMSAAYELTRHAADYSGAASLAACEILGRQNEAAFLASMNDPEKDMRVEDCSGNSQSKLEQVSRVLGRMLELPGCSKAANLDFY